MEMAVKALFAAFGAGFLAAQAVTLPADEGAQRQALKTLKGKERIDYAVAVRNARATSDALRIEAAKAVVDGVSFEFGTWGKIWSWCYLDNESDGELKRLEKECFASFDVLGRLAPDDLEAVRRRADAYLYRYTRTNDGADAERALRLYNHEIKLREKEAHSADAYAYCRAWWGRLNAIYALKGRRLTAAAIREYDKVGAKMSWGRYRRFYSALISDVRRYLEEDPLDLLKLPFHTGAKAFPEPQQADYTDEFVTLPSVRIETRGIGRNDPRFHLLEVKYARFGIPIRNDAPFAVKVVVDSQTRMFNDLKNPAVFAKVHEGKPCAAKAPREFRDYMANEGYSLEVGKKGATIQAKTKQGALWGLVSLIQMTDPEKKAVRVAKIRDWPDVEKRGSTGRWWAPTLEYMLFQKMNTIDHQGHPCEDNHLEPLSWFLEEELGRQMNDFGLELFYGMKWISHCPQIPIAYPRTLAYRISVLKRYAKAHIGVYYPLDDIRFPVTQPDLEKFGSATAIDGKHITDLYRGVVKEFPDWRFIVCAPFYWGPDGRCRYPENRDVYLAQMRKDLDPRIDIYWTGGRVKTWGIELYQTKWALQSYGRRPYLFQNAMGLHNLLDYTIDALTWPDLYEKDVLDVDLKGYHLNSTTPEMCAYIGTLDDALWNVAGFVAERSAKRSAQQLMGEKSYDLLKEGYEDLCYFDKYKYGACGDEVKAENLEDLERRVATIDRAWASATNYVRSIGARMYGRYGDGVGYAHRVLDSRRRLQDFDTKEKTNIGKEKK